MIASKVFVSGIILAATSSSGFSQSITGCATCSFFTVQDFCVQNSSTVIITNCEVITDASGAAAGNASEREIDFSSMSPSCFPDDPRSTSMSSGFRNGPNSFSGVMVNRLLSVGGGASDPGAICSNSFSFLADLGSAVQQPCQISASVSTRDIITFEVVSDLGIPPRTVGVRYNARLGAAGGGAEIEIYTSEALEFYGQLNANAVLNETYLDTCIESVPSVVIQDESELLVGNYYRFGGSSGGVGGLLAVKPGLQYIRLGLFLDPSIVVSQNGDNLSALGTAEFNLTLSPANGVVSMSELWDSYSVAIGDVNGDDSINYCDSDLLQTLIGSVLGDALYDPRGDMDIDGDIDLDDVARAEIEFAKAIGNYPCRADYNGDGAVNFFDITAMTADFQNQNPRADINCDGEFNFFDISAFIVLNGQGCN